MPLPVGVIPFINVAIRKDSSPHSMSLTKFISFAFVFLYYRTEEGLIISNVQNFCRRCSSRNYLHWKVCKYNKLKRLTPKSPVQFNSSEPTPKISDMFKSYWKSVFTLFRRGNSRLFQIFKYGGQIAWSPGHLRWR